MGQDRTQAPEGWTVKVSRTLYGKAAVWEVEKAGVKATWKGSDSTLEIAHEKGVEYAWRLEDETNSPAKPADPAWMVEVVREANAVGYDLAKMPAAAMDCRSGERDHDSETATAVRALCLALERGHVVEIPRPSEEEMLKAAREDAAQVNDDRYPSVATAMRGGHSDDDYGVRAALQARRNMLLEMGAKPSNWMPPVKEGLVAGSMPREMDPDFREVGELVWRSPHGAVTVKRSSIDLEAELKRAWDAGYDTAVAEMQSIPTTSDPRNVEQKGDDVRMILSTLPAKE